MIALFTLGGTIAMSGDSGPVIARLSGADMAATLPIAVEIHDVLAIPSASLSYADILGVLSAASGAVRAGAEGVVVTQGTDTLEETAYLLDLLWPHPEPLIVTGAMRNPTLAGPDGPANLLASVQVASAPAVRGLGVLVVFNDEIHTARWVRKTHSTNPATFASPETGPIGHVTEGAVRLLATPLRRPALAVPPVDAVSATVVPLHTATLDDDGVLLHHLASGSFAAGLVVSAFGVGHMPAALAPVLEDLAGRMPIVLASRTGAGSVLRETYGAVGGEKDLQRRGLINGRALHPYKARVLLRVLLASGAGHDGVSAAFADRG